MVELTTIEAKAYVPAKDFTLSKQFYQDLGFEIVWSSDDLAYVRKGRSSFLLQRFYNKEHAENFMMHLLVADVEAWWSHVQAQGLIDKYGVTAPHRSPAIGSLALIAIFVIAVAGAFAYTAGWLSPQRLTPGKLVDAFAPPSGV